MRPGPSLAYASENNHEFQRQGWRSGGRKVASAHCELTLIVIQQGVAYTLTSACQNERGAPRTRWPNRF